MRYLLSEDSRIIPDKLALIIQAVVLSLGYLFGSWLIISGLFSIPITAPLQTFVVGVRGIQAEPVVQFVGGLVLAGLATAQLYIRYRTKMDIPKSSTPPDSDNEVMDMASPFVSRADCEKQQDKCMAGVCSQLERYNQLLTNHIEHLRAEVAELKKAQNDINQNILQWALEGRLTLPPTPHHAPPGSRTLNKDN